MNQEQPTPPAELIISREPEFPGQVVWECGSTLGVAKDEATAQSDAAAICREVAALSDEELEAGFRAWYHQRHGFPYYGAVPLVDLIEWTRDFATRWGRPTPAPASEPLAQSAYVAFVQICKGNSDDAGTYEKDEELVRNALKRLSELEGPAPVPLLPEDAQPIEPTESTILAPVPVPVAVSERLPGPDDCLDEGWAWFFSPRVGWRQAVLPVSAAYTHWLPAHALPLPSGEVK